MTAMMPHNVNVSPLMKPVRKASSARFIVVVSVEWVHVVLFGLPQIECEDPGKNYNSCNHSSTLTPMFLIATAHAAVVLCRMAEVSSTREYFKSGLPVVTQVTSKSRCVFDLQIIRMVFIVLTQVVQTPDDHSKSHHREGRAYQHRRC